MQWLTAIYSIGSEEEGTMRSGAHAATGSRRAENRGQGQVQTEKFPWGDSQEFLCGGVCEGARGSAAVPVSRHLVAADQSVNINIRWDLSPQNSMELLAI